MGSGRSIIVFNQKHVIFRNQDFWVPVRYQNKSPGHKPPPKFTVFVIKLVFSSWTTITIRPNQVITGMSYDANNIDAQYRLMTSI